jgi:hypothetical protein
VSLPESPLKLNSHSPAIHIQHLELSTQLAAHFADSTVSEGDLPCLPVMKVQQSFFFSDAARVPQLALWNQTRNEL